jgi:hypothetical protein
MHLRRLGFPKEHNSAFYVCTVYMFWKVFLNIIVVVVTSSEKNYNIFFTFADEKKVALRIILIKHYGMARLNIILMI